MGKNNDLRLQLKKNFGFDTFKGNQEQIIKNVLDGKDTFVLMPTGGGKSLCYQLPALLLQGTAIIISPLIALMKNQVDAIRNYNEIDGVAHFLNSTLNKATVEKVREDILTQKTKMLYVAPESLTKEENIALLQQVKISFYAIDEAHCISEWGHDFRPEYRRIRPIIDQISTAPIIALTATATPKVQNDIQKNLGITEATVFKSSFNRPNLYYEVRKKNQDIDKEIIKYIRANKQKSGIIYCLSRKKVEELAATLQVNNINALPYHAGLDALQRTQNQDKFLMEQVDVIVATIAFGMGIDKPDVRFVIHYDIPKSLEGYYQETGRGGRDGGEGKCIAFYSTKDMTKLKKFNNGKPIAEQEVSTQLLLETQAYAETSMCRRKLLLHYFGENYPNENCQNCDNCLHPKKNIDCQELLILVLETIKQVKQKFKTEHIIDILLGNNTSDINSYQHKELENFGAAKEQDEKLISAIIRQALLEDYIAKDIETYGILKFTKKGKNYLKKPEKFMVTKDIEFDDEDESLDNKIGGRTGAADDVLFLILKDLRKKMSKKLDLPPFVIFQDPSLEAMATNYPISMEELQNIPGVGKGKAKRFGEEFLKVIKEHVKENEIIRPEDLRFRSVANKSKLKISIIQAIDRKIALDDIALSKGLDIDEILDEIEAIVYSGTKININYFLNEVMEEDKMEEIFDYFSTAKTDKIADALEVLGEDDFTETDIRLVRIKFLSEVGN